MREENKAMQNYLKHHGIECRVKYIWNGSMKHTWRLYNPDIRWSDELAQQLNDLGFRDFDYKPLGKYSGNGGVFSVCVRGNYSLNPFIAN